MQVFHITGSNTVYGSETDLALISAEESYILCVTVESSNPEISKLLQQKLGETKESLRDTIAKL